MSHFTFDYQKLLRQRGFRITTQRQLILDAICASGNHTKPDAIFAWVHAKAPAIHRATVYRNLDFLCDMRLVVAAQIGRHRYFELAGAEPHHHLVCRKCNAIEQLSHGAVKDFFSKVEREQSFLIDMDHLALFGLCKKCRRANSPKSLSPIPTSKENI